MKILDEREKRFFYRISDLLKYFFCDIHKVIMSDYFSC